MKNKKGVLYNLIFQTEGRLIFVKNYDEKSKRSIRNVLNKIIPTEKTSYT